MQFNEQRSYGFFPAFATAIFIILFYFFFNFNYLSNWIDEKGDARTYNYYVNLGIPKYLYNPHHLFFDWLGQRFLKAAVHNGYQGSSMRILQLRNLIISSICLGIIFLLFYFFSKRFILSLLFTFFISFSCAVWIYAQINDTGLIHSILLFILFMAVLFFPRVKHKIVYSFFLGFFHSIIVITFHQTDIIFSFIIFFIMVIPKTMKHKNMCKMPSPGVPGFYIRKHNPCQNAVTGKKSPSIFCFFIYILVLLIIVLAAYYYIGIIVLDLSLDPGKAGYFNHIKGSSYFFNWIVLYTNINYWGKGFIKGNLFEKAITGITTYFYQPGEWEGKSISWDFQSFTAPHALLPNMILCFIFIILAATLLFFMPLYKEYNYILSATLLFLLLYVLLACWWEPDYREFWIVPMLAFCFLGFLVCNFICVKTQSLWPLPHYSLYLFLCIITALLFYFNFTQLMYPYASGEFRTFDIILENR